MRWLPHYSSKNNIKLSDKDNIIGALDRAMMISGELPRSSNTASTFNTQRQHLKTTELFQISGCIIKIIINREQLFFIFNKTDNSAY